MATNSGRPQDTQAAHRAACLTYLDYAHYRAGGGYEALRDCCAGRQNAEAVRSALQAAGLGALFGEGRGRPLIINLAQAAPIADARLEHDPHRAFEALLVAAWALDSACIRIDLALDAQALCELLVEEVATLRQELPLAGLTPIEIGCEGPSTGAQLCGFEALSGLCDRLAAALGGLRRNGF